MFILWCPWSENLSLKFLRYKNINKVAIYVKFLKCAILFRSLARMKTKSQYKIKQYLRQASCLNSGLRFSFPIGKFLLILLHLSCCVFWHSDNKQNTTESTLYCWYLFFDIKLIIWLKMQFAILLHESIHVA